MQSFQVNRNAWHYRWICFYWACLHHRFWANGGSAVDYFEGYCLRPGDFCQYIRMAFLWPTLVIGFNLFLYWLAYWSYANSTGEGATILFYATLAISAIFIFAAGFVVVVWLFGTALKKVVPPEKAGALFNTAYHSWKDRYCPTLEYGETQ